jgi:cell division protein FtsB
LKSLWGQGERYLRIRQSAIDISPRVARLLIIGIILLVAAIFIASDVGLWNLWNAQKSLDVVESEIEELQGEIAYLKADIESLENDPFAIERVAREKYGYMRPGERVYRIVTLSPLDKKGYRPASALDNGGDRQ